MGRARGRSGGGPRGGSGEGGSVTSAVVRLRGLPFQATETEVKEFFASFNVVNVHIGKRNGRATGEAYVQFDSEANAVRALQERNRQSLGHRYIEIFEASESDLAHLAKLPANTGGGAIGASAAVGRPSGSGAPVVTAAAVPAKPKGLVVRMRGLPYTATVAEIADFFDGVALAAGSDSICLTSTQDGRPTGEAYVEFADDAALKEALKRHKNSMGSRYIELFSSSKSDITQAERLGPSPVQGQVQGQIQGNQHATAEATIAPPPPRPVHTKRGSYAAAAAQVPSTGPAAEVDGSTLKLRGLPYSAGVDEITGFFEGFSLVTEGVQLISSDRGGRSMNTGVAYVQFDTADEAERARDSRNNAMLGARYIECSTHTGVQGKPGPAGIGGVGPVGSGKPTASGGQLGGSDASLQGLQGINGEQDNNGGMPYDEQQQMFSQHEYQHQMMMQQQMMMHQQHYMMQHQQQQHQQHQQHHQQHQHQQQQQQHYDPQSWSAQGGHQQGPAWYPHSQGYGNAQMQQGLGQNMGIGMNMGIDSSAYKGGDVTTYGLHGGIQGGPGGAGLNDDGLYLGPTHDQMAQHYTAENYRMHGYQLGTWQPAIPDNAAPPPPQSDLPQDELRSAVPAWLPQVALPAQAADH